jgi:hypothetical protein
MPDAVDEDAIDNRRKEGGSGANRLSRLVNSLKPQRNFDRVKTGENDFESHATTTDQNSPIERTRKTSRFFPLILNGSRALRSGRWDLGIWRVI